MGSTQKYSLKTQLLPVDQDTKVSRYRNIHKHYIQMNLDNSVKAYPKSLAIINSKNLLVFLITFEYAPRQLKISFNRKKLHFPFVPEISRFDCILKKRL